MKGRFVVCYFYLNGMQRDNFSKFYDSNRTEILTKDILNKKCNQSLNSSKHSVLLIEITQVM